MRGTSFLKKAKKRENRRKLKKGNVENIINNSGLVQQGIERTEKINSHGRTFILAMTDGYLC
jgi:hypothetical protein